MKGQNKFATNSRISKEYNILQSSPLLLISIVLVFSFANCSRNEKLADEELRIGRAIEDITPN
jgi:hypothetical protein